MYCREEASCRGLLTDLMGRGFTYLQLIGQARAIKSFVKWMMSLGRLGQFALAKRLLYDSE
jgi:hypothetical protein